MKKRNTDQFIEAHGQKKLKMLKHELEVEHAKVAALAGKQNVVIVQKQKDCVIRFGATGDRHYGSLYHNGAALQGFYDYCKSEGVPVIYDAGDLLDGHRVYKGQEFELLDVGFEAQVSRIEREAPRSVPTKFITGNHDASFKNAAGIIVGYEIQKRIQGYEFLGEEQATIRYETPNGPFDLMLMHPGGGSSYALSYKLQKLIEALEGGTKPNMLVAGHLHKSIILPSYRNVCGVMAGTFQDQTPFMARNGLAAHRGGWLFEITVGETFNIIKNEFVAVY